MNLNSTVINALKPLGITVRFQELFKEDGAPDTYITFFEYNQTGSLYADDEEQATAHSIQVDIWSKGNYTELVEQVKAKLNELDFKRTSEIDLYEKDTKIYHKAIRFSFTNSN
jgi:hypothetical protein